MDEKIIILAEIPVKPEFFEDVKTLCEITLEHTLQEKGCEAFYQTFKKNEPYTLVFFEIFSSQKSLDIHLNADYTKTFFAGIKDKISGKSTSSFLCEFR